ncbi:MAG: hypothetical protein HJHJAOHD_01825 [Flavobacteriales bacterium]|nr:hypothetical protein [Flavobacteriales bacterium]MCL4815478.1 DUF1697 domain-containing protein [Flavobacteriales bacterium]WKZ75097.1 MAG: DUF1697 domain-containing protein [Vicingaceae bacterium]
MTTYISILRGINVSEQKPIKMDRLRKLFQNLGFNNVTTYVQSGNVVFQSNGSEVGHLEQKISQQIQKDFEFKVPVIVLTINELSQIINNNPFKNNLKKEHKHLYVTFLSSKPKYYEKEIIESKIQKEEEIYFSEKAVYLYCPNGYGRTKLNNNFLEATLKVAATTRNWKTTNELFKMANQIN